MPTRESRRTGIVSFFSQNIGRSFSTAELHSRFGSAFRSRTSEINRDPGCAIVIRNQTSRLEDGSEASFYWSEWRAAARSAQPAFPQFGSLAPELEYPN